MRSYSKEARTEALTPLRDGDEVLKNYFKRSTKGNLPEYYIDRITVAVEKDFDGRSLGTDKRLENEANQEAFRNHAKDMLRGLNIRNSAKMEVLKANDLNIKDVVLDDEGNASDPTDYMEVDTKSPKQKAEELKYARDILPSLFMSMLTVSKYINVHMIHALSIAQELRSQRVDLSKLSNMEIGKLRRFNNDGTVGEFVTTSDLKYKASPMKQIMRNVPIDDEKWINDARRLDFWKIIDVLDNIGIILKDEDLNKYNLTYFQELKHLKVEALNRAKVRTLEHIKKDIANSRYITTSDFLEYAGSAKIKKEENFALSIYNKVINSYDEEVIEILNRKTNNLEGLYKDSMKLDIKNTMFPENSRFPQKKTKELYLTLKKVLQNKNNNNIILNEDETNYMLIDGSIFTRDSLNPNVRTMCLLTKSGVLFTIDGQGNLYYLDFQKIKLYLQQMRLKGNIVIDNFKEILGGIPYGFAKWIKVSN